MAKRPLKSSSYLQIAATLARSELCSITGTRKPHPRALHDYTRFALEQGLTVENKQTGKPAITLHTKPASTGTDSTQVPSNQSQPRTR